jgi:N-formylglutamate amidohydrolase
LVRAYSDPGLGKHSLQIELNKGLYAEGLARSANYGQVKSDLQGLVAALAQYVRSHIPRKD